MTGRLRDAVATKSRLLKTAMQLWVADNRKRLGLKPHDLAVLTGVTDDTARAWESRGQPSEDALVILERRFGVPRPREDAPTGDMAALIAALTAHTAALHDSASGKAYTPIPEVESLATAIAALTTELQAARTAREAYEARLRAVESELKSLHDQLGDGGSQGRSAPPPTAGSGR